MIIYVQRWKSWSMKGCTLFLKCPGAKAQGMALSKTDLISKQSILEIIFLCWTVSLNFRTLVTFHTYSLTLFEDIFFLCCSKYFQLLQKEIHIFKGNAHSWCSFQSLSQRLISNFSLFPFKVDFMIPFFLHPLIPNHIYF
jgi:hypothetical protein